MNRVRVKQHDATDCAAACLASVAAFYKLNVPLARIRAYASTDSRGTNVKGMLEAARHLGFSARGVKASFEHLKKIPLPTIGHVTLKQGCFHFVVILKASDRDVRIMDPADGKFYRILRDQFIEQWTGVLVILAPAENFQPGRVGAPIILRLLHLLKPHRALLLQVLFGAIVYTLLGLSVSIFVQKIVDHVLPSGNTNLLNLMGVVMMVLLFMQVFINHVKSVLTFKSGQLIDIRLILGYYRHVFRLPQTFFDNMKTGELISRVNDAFKIRLFVNDVLVGGVVNLSILLFSFGLMFTYYWKLALIILLGIPLFALIYAIANQLNRKTQRKLMEQAADLESELVSSLQAAPTIKRFGAEEFVITKMERRLVRLLRTIYASSMNGLWAGNLSEFVATFFKIILLWAGAVFVMKQEITPGELLSFYAIISYFTGPVISLVEMNRLLQDAFTASSRLFDIMDLEPIEQSRRIQFTPDMAGPIHFRDVTFRYGSGACVFQGLNLTISPGKITALVGESGSGKSTLSCLLQGLYMPEAGAITINAVDLLYVDQPSLREVVGVVPQNVQLLSGSLLENIALGEIEPDVRKALSVCGQAGLMEFVEALPGGLYAHLGENGIRLSGGQKQRVAIARALYREPEILILDEATSSLDAVAEQQIQTTVRSLRNQGKTVIFITHRLRTVQDADRIVVLHKGIVKESGNHADLLARKGLYYRLWQKQFVN